MLKRSRFAVLAVALRGIAPTAFAGPSWQTGRINNVTVSGDQVLITLDSGLPDNCAGTAYGWMMISPSYKAMQALVLALWARGDMGSSTLTVFTSGLVGGYCQVTQLDPAES